MKAGCSLAVALATALLWSCKDSSPEGAADGQDRPSEPESAAPSSAAHSSSKRPAEAVSAPPTGASGSEAALAPSKGGARPPDGLPRNLHTSRPPDRAAPSASSYPRAAAAPSALADARARQAAGSSLESPVDFQRLAESIREKYELDAAQDPAAQLQSLLDRFEQGDIAAALPIGLFLAYGDAAVADPARAAEFFRVASDNGEPRGFAELGRLSLTGRGLPEDAAAAEALFAQAMAEGDPEGAFLLATGNRLELFPGADPASYRELLEAAASLGHPSAANSIFLLAEEGQLDLADYPQMEQWLLKGAETGSLESLRALSNYYLSSGQDEKAIVAIQLAAESGSLNAVFELMAGGPVARYAKDPAKLAAVRATLAPHAAGGGPQAGEAQLLLAFLQAVAGDAAGARASLEQAAAGPFHQKIQVALKMIESGAEPTRAIAAAGSMTSEEAYVAHQQNRARSGVDAPPRLLSALQPAYPVELMAEGRRGAVIVELTIDAAGAVSRSRVISSDHPALSAAAIKAASGWKFDPALSNGEPSEGTVRVPFLFEPAP